MANLSGLVANLAAECQPELVYVIRVNKWFDHKWLRFSGMGRVAIDDSGGLVGDTALDNIWQDELTFPPFNPNQVGEQLRWHQAEHNTYLPVSGERPPHDSARRHSSGNLQNRVRNYSTSGVFVWFSSNSKINMRASILVYTVDGKNEEAWYASFGDRDNWGVDRVKGISQKQVQEWLPLG